MRALFDYFPALTSCLHYSITIGADEIFVTAKILLRFYRILFSVPAQRLFSTRSSMREYESAVILSVL